MLFYCRRVTKVGGLRPVQDPLCLNKPEYSHYIKEAYSYILQQIKGEMPVPKGCQNRCTGNLIEAGTLHPFIKRCKQFRLVKAEYYRRRQERPSWPQKQKAKEK